MSWNSQDDRAAASDNQRRIDTVETVPTELPELFRLSGRQRTSREKRQPP
jgi:hypothetical protein